jgi:hypothetical protein
MPVFAGGDYAGVFDGQRMGFSCESGEGGRYLGQAGPDVGGHGAHGAWSSPVVLVAGVGFGDGEAEVPLYPVGFQNSATGLDLGFYAARSYSLIRPPRTGRRLIRSWERSATGWSGRGVGAGGCDGGAVRCSGPRTGPGSSVDVAGRRSASGR